MRFFLYLLLLSLSLSAGGRIESCTAEAKVSPSISMKVDDKTESATPLEVDGGLRMRYTYVDAKNDLKSASALTGRVNLGVGAPLYGTRALRAYVALTGVFGVGRYWDLSRNDADRGLYDVVADPTQTRITQAYLDYTSQKRGIRVGRQMITLDNQRFVGSVDWRQMPQSFDAISLFEDAIPHLHLSAAYLWRVNTVFDKESLKRVGDGYGTQSILLHGDYALAPQLTITAYDYMLENFADTYGIALKGKSELGKTMLAYRAEYARQIDPTQGSGSADTDYYLFHMGATYSGMLFALQYERLGAGGLESDAFQTPLATLHAHNGWGDLFLKTPETGLRDASLTLGYKSKLFGLFKTVYHDFRSDRGSVRYGQELDLLYKRKLETVDGLSLWLKGALYRADRYKVDTSKFWVMVDYHF